MIDIDTFDYVMDKGPVTDFRVGENGSLESYCSLRMFGLRKGYTEFGELPGHYFINAWSGGEEKAVQCIQAPALVHFKDCGLAPAFVLEWKCMNEKLYGMTLATAVKVSGGGDQDRSEKWLQASDVRPVRVDLMYSVQPIENRDGVPLKKNLDAWLSNHGGERRKALSLTSMSAHRNWCSHSSFTNNFKLVSNAVQTALENAIRESTRHAAHQIDAAIAKQLPPLLRMSESICEHLALIGVPLAHRLMELQIDPEAEVKDMYELISAALGRSDQNKEKATQLFELLRKGERFKCLQEGKCTPQDVMSPLMSSHTAQNVVPASPAVVANDDATPNIARQLNFASGSAPAKGSEASTGEAAEDEHADDAENAGPSLRKKRTPTQVFEPTQCKKRKPTPKAKPDSNTRRSYMKSGLYSKDPVKAAIARAGKLVADGKVPFKGGAEDNATVPPPGVFEFESPHMQLAIVSVPLRLCTDFAKSTKMESQIKELKDKVKDQEGLISRLRGEIMSMESKSELLVEKNEEGPRGRASDAQAD